MTTQEDRTIDVFVTDLRRRAEHCDFGALKDSLIRGQIVVGISDPKLREEAARPMEQRVTNVMGETTMRAAA